MKVKLIQMTQNPIDVMWVAARTCYSEESPIEIWEDMYDCKSDGYEHTCAYIEQCVENHWKLVKRVLDSGHASIAEHVYFTFCIENVSRVLLAQITRHRAGIVFSVKSQRYVEIKESFETISELFENPQTDKDEDYLLSVANKYFVGVNKDNYRMYIQTLLLYLQGIKLGMKPEDARMILPNATKTNIVMSVNLRELMHTSNLRLCSRAQLEIRKLFQAIVKEVEEKDERLASLLVPTCEVHGFCAEHQCCGRKPKLSEVKENYEKYKDLKN
jgi:thymidylate synthase (FAD)